LWDDTSREPRGLHVGGQGSGNLGHYSNHPWKLGAVRRDFARANCPEIFLQRYARAELHRKLAEVAAPVGMSRIFCAWHGFPN